MDEKQYFKEIKNIEKRYFKLLSLFPLGIPKAINLQEEKKKFFAAIADDRKYNPFIRFDRPSFDRKKIKDLKKFKIDTKNDIYGLKKLYKKAAKRKISQIEARLTWGDAESTKHVVKFHGRPNSSLVRKAKKFCRGYHREKIKFTRLDYKKVGRELVKEVKRLTNKKIKVKFESIAAKVNIEPAVGFIQINKNEKFTSLDLKRLKVHEIGTHYMRYYNGHKSGIKLLELGTANYLETEEGLAAYMEEIKGVSSNAQMYVYAGRVIATHYALKKSFYQLFKILKNYGFENQVAFAITYRAKRNLSDTSKKGGFTKDYVYFSGYHKVKKYAQNNDLKDLFVGKINLDDLKSLDKFISKRSGSLVTILD